MKTLSLYVVLLSASLFFIGCDSEDEVSPTEQRVIGSCDISSSVNSLPLGEISDAEKEDLLFMVEEEKVAHDVYYLFYQNYSQQVFINIAQSEAAHICAVSSILDRYNIQNPTDNTAIAEFTNPALQALYDQLVTEGEASLVSGLSTGALIEEVDIADLRVALQRTDNQDIALVYESLMKGSRNHLRSFVGNLSNQGISYQPQVLSEEDYLEIINSPMENGRKR